MTEVNDMLGRIAGSLRDVCDVWAAEMRRIFKDEGIVLFFFVLPLAYPLLYSWIYNNEVVRDVPVVVVDDSRTQLSREFCRMCDASADVNKIGRAHV